jgi:hypothetical protein
MIHFYSRRAVLCAVPVKHNQPTSSSQVTSAIGPVAVSQIIHPLWQQGTCRIDHGECLAWHGPSADIPGCPSMVAWSPQPPQQARRWPFEKGEMIDIPVQPEGQTELVGRLNDCMQTALEEWSDTMVADLETSRKAEANQRVVYVYDMFVNRGLLSRDEMRNRTARLTQPGDAKSSKIRLAELEVVAREAMDADTKPYAAAWAQIQSDGGAAALTDLEGVVAGIQQSGKPRQQYGSQVTIENKDTATHYLVRDGDRLYLQCGPGTLELIREACECFPLFDTFVKELASRTNATTASTGRKTLRRAAEKVARSYLDWGLVTDLVRGSLLYPTLPSLVAALQALLRTRGVKVLRVKNRFATEYDADRHGGYRDLLINLRIAGSKHVCELQLNLDDMYKLKTGAGHAHYVQYRNAMME